VPEPTQKPQKKRKHRPVSHVEACFRRHLPGNLANISYQYFEKEPVWHCVTNEKAARLAAEEAKKVEEAEQTALLAREAKWQSYYDSISKRKTRSTTAAIKKRAKAETIIIDD
jgi:hypothetical protein